MVKRIVWTENAHNERKEILLFWRNHNQSTVYSKKLNELIKKAIQLISAHPHIGRKADVKNVRVKLVRDYLLFYEETDDTIIILSIWDNRRNPDEAPY
jgi:addiction module RelE/StbE family toxin